MNKRILIEEFHLTVLVASNLPPPEIKQMVKILRSKPFQQRIKIAMTGVFAEYPGLINARIQVTK